MIRKLSNLCILCILSFCSFGEPLFAQNLDQLRQTALRIGKLFGPKPYSSPPSWSKPNTPPLFSFAWLSDMHLDEANQQRMAQTLSWIDQHLKPTFLLLTGDNNAIVPVPAPTDPALRDFRRQQYLQQWLGEHWKRPYVIIPGDNWPGGFDRVFGPRQYRVECGGLHLVMLAPDVLHHGPGMEGLSAFDPETLDWLCKDLDKYRDHPTLVAIHEPIYPPTFLDAPKLRKLIQAAPQVLGVLQGHLHVDMELREGKQTYWVAPAVGPGQPPAFKYLSVYRHAIIMRTAELDSATGQWRLTEKWQKIDIPEPFQKVLHSVDHGNQVAQGNPVHSRASVGENTSGGSEKPCNRVSSRPARPVRDDPSLTRRAGELLEIGQQFLWKEAPTVLLKIRDR